jgi:hypothetical protein
MMMLMQGQQGGTQEHPLARAFAGTPMYGGVPILPSQMFDMNVLGLGGSGLGQTAGMLMQGLLPGLMGPEFTPGQFAPTQNIVDHKRSLDYFMQRRQAMEKASKADTETYFRMIRGMSRMAGVEWTPEQAAQGMRFAQDFTPIMGIIGDMMPELVDQASGRRGSSRIMAGRLFEAGRYGFDPVSGRLGMSGTSAGQISENVFNQLYGPGADLSRMHGLGAGRAGQMYEEMVKRGYGVSAILPEEAMGRLQKELARPAADIASPELANIRRTMERTHGVSTTGLRPEDAGKIERALKDMDATDPQALDSALRSFNASRVAKTIENMSGAVAAMRDIFGDMGRPNAPMIELINGLQAMTQGGMSHMTPQQLEQSVRTTYNVAKSTGLGLEGMMGFAGTASQILEQQMGPMGRPMGWQVGQSSAAYGFGFGLTQQPTAYGALNREQASQIDLGMRARAAASPQAVRLGAFMRFADEFQRKDGGTGFKEGSEAYAIAEALRQGETTYEVKPGGPRRSVFQAGQNIVNILAKEGISRSEAMSAITSGAASSAEYISRYNIQDVVREGGQTLTDIRPAFSTMMGNAANAALAGNKDVPRAQRAATARRLGTAMFDIFQQLSEEGSDLLNAGNAADRNIEVARRLRDQLGDAGVGGMTDAALANMAGSAWRRGEAFIANPQSGMSHLQSMTGMLQMTNRRTFELQRRTQTEMKGLAQLQSAMAAVGQEHIVGRLSDYLQSREAGKPGSIKDLAMTLAGGIQNTEMAAPIQALLNRVTSLQEEYEEAGRNIRNPRERKQVQERILHDIRTMGSDVNRLVESGSVGEAMPGLSPEARRAIDQSQKARKDKEKAGTPDEDKEMSAANQKVRRAQDDLDNQRKKLMDADPELRKARGRQKTAEDAVKTAQDTLQKSMDVPAGLSAEKQQEALKKQQEAREGLRLAQQFQQDAQTGLTKATHDAEAAADKDPTMVGLKKTVTEQLGERNKLMNKIRKGQGLEEIAGESAEQIKYAATEREYKQAQEAVYKEKQPVKEAMAERKKAEDKLQAVREEIKQQTQTPELEEAEKEQLAAREELDAINREREVVRKGPGSAADKQAALAAINKRWKDTQKKVQAAVTKVRQVRSAAHARVGKDLREREQTAEKEYTDADKRVRTAKKGVRDEVEKDASVIEARARKEEARKRLPGGRVPGGTTAPHIPEPGKPGVPSAAGAPGTGGGGAVTSRDVQVSGTNVVIRATHVNFSEVPKIELAAKEVKQGGKDGSAGVAAAGPDLIAKALESFAQMMRGKGENIDPTTGASGKLALSGAVRLEGLDTLLFGGATASPTETRGA